MNLFNLSENKKSTVFSILDNQFSEFLSTFELEKATLFIDQLLDIHSDAEGTPNKFIQEYVINLLDQLYRSKTEIQSRANQADQVDVNLVRFLDEMGNLEQGLIIGAKSMDRTIVLANTTIADFSKPDDFISSMVRLSKSSKLFAFPSFAAGSFLFSDNFFGKDYIIIIPFISEDPPQYDAVEVEHINNFSSSVSNYGADITTKKSLIGYEFLKSFNDKNKKRFFRSFIRNVLFSKYENSNIRLENISILLESKNDVNLFNSELKNIIDLLKYNFSANIDMDFDEFLQKHPYLTEDRIQKIDQIKSLGPMVSSGSNGIIFYTDWKAKEKNGIKSSDDKVTKPKNEFKLFDELYKNLYPRGEKVITSDPYFKKELERILTVKEFQQHILLLGESGVGKTDIAYTIHSLTNRIKNKKIFVAVNCAAIPDTLIESELFGYAKGAHSTAGKGYEGLIKSADGGTLFLDEIGKAPLNVQAKLLKFIDEKVYYSVGSSIPKKVDTRIIFATNEDPLSLIKRAQMLPDFYYRISKYKFTIPPLRNRKKDLEIFIKLFKKRCEADFNISIRRWDDALKYMLNLEWPGNIRQVENTMCQIFLKCKSDNLSEITTSLVEQHIENITQKNFGTFTNFNESFRSFFEYWKSNRSEFNYIQTEKTIDGSESEKKNNSNNSHSFLKLIIEPMAAHTYNSMNLQVSKSSELLGLSLGDKKNYSPYYDKLNVYPKIKKVFEKLEN